MIEETGASIRRVRDVINGRQPDRTPMFDLLRNSAVFKHFTGIELTPVNGAEVIHKVYEPAIDATRPSIKFPNLERVEKLPDGRRQEILRWTIWTEKRQYADSEEYAREKREQIESFDPSWTPEHQERLDGQLASIAETRRRLGDVFLFPGIPGPGLMGTYGEVGLEQFSYFLADCPEIAPELLEINTVKAEQWYRHLPEDHGIEAGFGGDDIAFKSGPLMNPAWMREHYFPRLARCISAAHQRGIKVLFHSDGNLMPILDDLVAAGIDGLNPIEVLAGMDVGEIHRRHPHLFMTGGIDVSQLLPYGSPQEVKDAVHKAIDDAEGRIMIGSSTELNEGVPLSNFLAMREAVIEHG